MIKWQESYSTGVVKLDDQHKSLFRYCNELEEGLNCGGISKEALERDLTFLERYVKGHFGQEETCMQQCACAVAGKNKLAHQQFIEAFKKFEGNIKEDGDNGQNLREFHHFVETWLTEHICKIDVQLKPYVH